MDSGEAVPGIAVMSHPDVAAQMLFQDEDVPAASGYHSRRGCSSRKSQPVGGEIKRRDDLAEQVKAGAATAERPRTTGRAASDDMRNRLRDRIADRWRRGTVRYGLPPLGSPYSALLYSRPEPHLPRDISPTGYAGLIWSRCVGSDAWHGDVAVFVHAGRFMAIAGLGVDRERAQQRDRKDGF
jgi:hypothetical protein